MYEWLMELIFQTTHPTTWQVTWLSIGFFGQCVFGSRFVIQWIVSEHKGRSVIPKVFWYLSIVGSLTLFSYAIVYLRDPVFTIGQGMGCFIYFRNLALLKREEKANEPND